MGENEDAINVNYEHYYAKIHAKRVYPTEFVVRTMLANYPELSFRKPKPGDSILDVAFGDGRNTVFLCELGLAVSGIEITQGIVDQTQARLSGLGLNADLRVGRNSYIPFGTECFDYILASHCIYYCDDGQTLRDNLQEYARVLKPGGFLVASVASSDSYIFSDSSHLPDGSRVIRNDPYGNRNGYRLFSFSTREDIAAYFLPTFSGFSFGFADNDYFGIQEKVFWVVCQRRE